MPVIWKTWWFYLWETCAVMLGLMFFVLFLSCSFLGSTVLGIFVHIPRIQPLDLYVCNPFVHCARCTHRKHSRTLDLPAVKWRCKPLSHYCHITFLHVVTLYSKYFEHSFELACISSAHSAWHSQTIWHESDFSQPLLCAVALELTEFDTNAWGWIGPTILCISSSRVILCEQINTHTEYSHI